MNPTSSWSEPEPDALILATRAVGAQLIVWHHLALYGPLPEALDPHGAALFDWLVQYARYAVQLFLVMAGFLAARLLDTRPPVGPALRRRWWRLAPAYWVALAAALAAGTLARALIHHDSVPAAPGGWDVLANVLMLQDIAGVEALSAGIWYVAIDLQLYALLLAIARWVPPRAARAVVVALALASLLWIGRDPEWDAWAPYFFGSYAFGLIACWARSGPHGTRWRVLLATLLGLALAVQWRDRIALAGITALFLSFPEPQLFGARARALLQYLADRSYELFLLHYPVLLATGALVHAIAPGSAGAAALGLLLAWALAMAAAHALHHALARQPQGVHASGSAGA